MDVWTTDRTNSETRSVAWRSTEWCTTNKQTGRFALHATSLSKSLASIIRSRSWPRLQKLQSQRKSHSCNYGRAAIPGHLRAPSWPGRGIRRLGWRPARKSRAGGIFGKREEPEQRLQVRLLRLPVMATFWYGAAAETSSRMYRDPRPSAESRSIPGSVQPPVRCVGNQRPLRSTQCRDQGQWS
jgi:hypothetical protein